MQPTTLSLLASYDNLLRLSAVLAAALLGGYLLRRRLEDRRAKKKLAEAVKLDLNVPQTLHPVINPDICIGSGSCVSACPEGKILGLVDGVGTLVGAHKCIGHGRCAAECPVGAISLVFGSAERGIDLPEVDEYFETGRAGVHIVGELAGMGLIKNALSQGLEVAARLKGTIDSRVKTSGVDVVIVGAGPAGIATAVGCRAAGLSYALLEQDTVGGTVAHYPRHKVVMTETVDLPYYGKFGRRLISKEELISSFGEVMGKADVKVHEKTKLTGITGEKDSFVVTTDRGILGRQTGGPRHRPAGQPAQDRGPWRGSRQRRLPVGRSPPICGQAGARGWRRRLGTGGSHPACGRDRREGGHLLPAGRVRPMSPAQQAEARRSHQEQTNRDVHVDRGRDRGARGGDAQERDDPPGSERFRDRLFGRRAAD
jgi:ferredoxin